MNCQRMLLSLAIMATALAACGPSGNTELPIQTKEEVATEMLVKVLEKINWGDPEQRAEYAQAHLDEFLAIAGKERAEAHGMSPLTTQDFNEISAAVESVSPDQEDVAILRGNLEQRGDFLGKAWKWVCEATGGCQWDGNGVNAAGGARG